VDPVVSPYHSPVGRIVFVTWYGGGNVNPVVALGRQLVEARHDVHVLGSASLRARFAAAELAFTGRDAQREWELEAIAGDVTDTCAAERPDVVVVDYMLPAALCATEALGLTTVALVHTLYGALLEDGTVTPMSMAASVGAVNALRGRLGIPPVDRLGDLLHAVRQVVVTVAADVDTVPDPLPANVAYVGPVFEGPGDDAGWQPPPGDGPLVVVSLGTTDMDELPLLATILAALAPEPVRVVATVGAHADPDQIPMPGNARVGPFVQHAAVLTHADLVITHGGIGTALAALAHGVPVLALPLGRDQPVNAAAIVATGAGKMLSAQASPGQIVVAVRQLLHDPAYRDAARRVGATMPRPGDHHPATDLIAALTESP